MRRVVENYLYLRTQTASGPARTYRRPSALPTADCRFPTGRTRSADKRTMLYTYVQAARKLLSVVTKLFFRFSKKKTFFPPGRYEVRVAPKKRRAKGSTCPISLQIGRFFIFNDSRRRMHFLVSSAFSFGKSQSDTV